MCNAANKAVIVALGFMALAACSKGDPDQAAAEALYQRAEQAYDQGDSKLALELMDSVDQKYPSQIDARRRVMALRPRAIETQTVKDIAQADSVIAYTSVDIEQMKPLFKHVSGGDLEGYYVLAKSYNPQYINTNGIEARVNDHDYSYYIVAQTHGKKLGITRVQLSGKGGSMESEPLPDNRLVSFEDIELATFSQNEVDDLGQWALSQGDDVTGGAIVGAKGTQKVSLSKAQAQALGQAWQFAHLMQKYETALNERRRLERQLQIARDQAANKNFE